MTWALVCAIEEFPSNTARTLDVNPPIAVFNVDGNFYAIDDTCTHEVWSLADGYMHGCQVECALHGARFDLRTGEALTLPATVPVRTYPVKSENGELFVDLSSRG